MNVCTFDRAVTDSINMLLNACMSAAPGQKECDNALRNIQVGILLFCQISRKVSIAFRPQLCKMKGELFTSCNNPSLVDNDELSTRSRQSKLLTLSISSCDAVHKL